MLSSWVRVLMTCCCIDEFDHNHRFDDDGAVLDCYHCLYELNHSSIDVDVSVVTMTLMTVITC